jgi:hypothetical protein
VADQEPILVSKELAARLLGISVDTLEREVMPDIRVVRIRRRVLFAVADLGAWVEDHSSVPLVSELPQHARESRAANHRLGASLPLQRGGIVDRTKKTRRGAGLSPAQRR